MMRAFMSFLRSALAKSGVDYDYIKRKKEHIIVVYLDNGYYVEIRSIKTKNGTKYFLRKGITEISVSPRKIISILSILTGKNLSEKIKIRE